MRSILRMSPHFLLPHSSPISTFHISQIHTFTFLTLLLPLFFPYHFAQRHQEQFLSFFFLNSFGDPKPKTKTKTRHWDPVLRSGGKWSSPYVRGTLVFPEVRRDKTNQLGPLLGAWESLGIPCRVSTGAFLLTLFQTGVLQSQFRRHSFSTLLF